MKELSGKAIALLQQLIATPSFSRQEDQTAAIIADFLDQQGIPCKRAGNNIWAFSKNWQKNQPTVLLNSHHDTVKPVRAWTRDPFEATIEGDVLYGLGSNDAGGPLVSLIATFLYFFQQTNSFNLILAATAEEEISGKNGIASIIEDLPPVHFAIVGEPTSLQMAVAEKGLMVIDATAQGKSGHAARNEGVNAIYLALQDIEWIKNYEFERVSPLLGKVKATVTQIEAGYQHNVVPDQCKFVIDVRSNECYNNQELLDILQKNTQSTLQARSLRLGSSGIAKDHPIVQAGKILGMNTYGSPTLSDQALLPFPSLKLGCGKSTRSHTANEYIKLSEIEKGIETYVQLLKQTNWKAI